MQPEDAIRIGHMIEATQTAERFVAGRQRSDLDTDEMLLFALVQAIQIVGMRNRLVHAHADIDHEFVWKTVTVEIPALLPLLTPLLSRD